MKISERDLLNLRAGMILEKEGYTVTPSNLDAIDALLIKLNETPHTCGGPVFGRLTVGCPRCDELKSGRAPRTGFKPHGSY